MKRENRNLCQQEQFMSRWTPNRVKEVATHGFGKYKGKEGVVCYSIRRDGETGSFVSYQRGSFNKKIMKAHFKITYYLKRVTGKW